MPQDATCPKCSHTFPVTEARGAYTVACPRCEAELTAEFTKPATPPEAGEPPYDLKVKAGALPGAATAPPPPRRKKNDDDEDEPKRKGGSAMVVLLSGGLGLLFVLGGLGVTGWFLFTQIDVEPTNNRNVSNRNTAAPNRPNTPNNPNVRPGAGPNPAPGNPWVDPTPTPDPPKKKKETFNLSPVGGALPPILSPANVDVQFTTQVALPGPAVAVSVGGGGRYIVFEIPTQSKLMIFDANTGGLLDATANTGGFGVQMAVGANKLVHTVPGTKKLRVLSLPDLQRQTEFEVPLFHGPRALAVGSRTNGPVLVSDPFGEVVLMDLASGQPIEGSQNKLEVGPDNLRASPDGKQFLVGGGFGSNEAHKLIEEVGSKWRVRGTGVHNAFLGADGRRLYGKNQIALTANGGMLAGKPVGVTGDVWYVPAVTATGNLFLRVNETRTAGRAGTWLSVHRNNTIETPAVPGWEGLNEMTGLVGAFGTPDTLDRHLFLIPEAKLLVILTRDKSKLVVRKLNI